MEKDTPNEIFFYDDVSTKETLLLNSNVHDEDKNIPFCLTIPRDICQKKNDEVERVMEKRTSSFITKLKKQYLGFVISFLFFYVIFLIT